ncbi:hypothetical protein L2E82_20312 [Cichorium intybus]|uniref:Uncharacterized protein n=1 Tax=Cichorium intybus TaxID=13427 RepID=A0ACB9DU01_CICIN|nr:hypothetical protein L2E82_20312 [Cichorium intybus]
MPSWKLMASVSEMNCPPVQSPVDRFNNFESALSPMVSSPVSNSAGPNDTFAVRELIGKLGSICNGGGELFPAAMAPVAAGATRKAATSKGKAKEIVSAVVKEEGNDDSNLKRQKKTEEDTISETEKKSKLPEPPKDYKDYIHVRARRGQATDSHSLAERVRREKISERMKLLQDLVPGCNKVTGKALMLDEIINYVQSLQHQVEFLSMKLATVNPRQDFDMNSQLCKDMSQSHGNLSQHLYAMETSTSEFYKQNPQVLFSGSTAITQSPVDPLPLVHGFTETFSHFTGFEVDDLHNIVKMRYTDNHDQTSEMKIEL